MTPAERPTPPIDPATGLWLAPIATIWRPNSERDTRPTDEQGRVLFDLEALRRRYTCAGCNKAWEYGDPGFDYFIFGPAGSPTEGLIVGTRGWFARCVNREQCEHRRTNNHAGQHPEALTLTDEALLVGAAAL